MSDALSPADIERIASAIVERLAKTPRPICIDQATAGKLTGLSWKTLERLSSAGAKLGRLKAQGRVVYHLDSLTNYFASQVEAEVSEREK